MGRPDLRLLLFTAEPWPTFRADVAILFGKYLPRYGIRSDIVAASADPDRPDAQWGGGEAHLCDAHGGAAMKRIRTLWHGMHHLVRSDRRRYSAIQVRDMPVLASFALIVARIKGLPFCYWMSYPIPEGQIELARARQLSGGVMKFFYPWIAGRVGRLLLYRWVLPRADHVFVQSERMKSDLVAKGVCAARLTPVPMGVDMERVRLDEILPADDARLEGRRALVYLGSLERPRRIEILFDMLALVKRHAPDALLVLAGDTEDAVHRVWLKEQARKAGVGDDVIWTGWLPVEDAWRYVRAAQVGLSPIPRGPLLDCSSPTKLLEYLALGVPVVCNDSPDQERVVRECGTGSCVPYSASEFADAVIRTLHAPPDERMRSKGQAYIRAHRNYERIARAVSLTYQSILGPADAKTSAMTQSAGPDAHRARSS